VAIISIGNGKGIEWEPTEYLICAKCREPFDPGTSLQTVSLMIDNSDPTLFQERHRIPTYWYLHEECRAVEKVLKELGANIRWRAFDMPYILGFRIEKDGYRIVLPNRLKRAAWFPPKEPDKRPRTSVRGGMSVGLEGQGCCVVAQEMLQSCL
jgi:hypothetical protein